MAEGLLTSEEGLCCTVLVHIMRVIVSCPVQLWS